MTSALYLEHYLDGLESLPTELKRNFTLMRELDSRAQTLMKNIDDKVTKLMEIQLIFKLLIFLVNRASKIHSKFKGKPFRGGEKVKIEAHPRTLLKSKGIRR